MYLVALGGYCVTSNVAAKGPDSVSLARAGEWQRYATSLEDARRWRSSVSHERAEQLTLGGERWPLTPEL